MVDLIKIRDLAGSWNVRAAGAVIVESSNVLELIEGDYDPVLYFPQSDIAMALLDKTDETSHCPHKGDATYYSIQTKNGPIENVAWSYETPKKSFTKLADYIAFYPHEKLTIEEV